MIVTQEQIKLCVSRDPRGQKEVYTILLPYLISICNRYLKNKSNRNDILQESFINIFTKIDQYDPDKGLFKSWAARITINKCLAYTNRTISRRETELSSAEYQIPIAPEVLSRLTNAEVLKLLQRMPRDYYEVFNLFVVDGFSHVEIGELLSIKKELSRKRLSRAREWIENRKEIKAMIG